MAPQTRNKSTSPTETQKSNVDEERPQQSKAEENLTKSTANQQNQNRNVDEADVQKVNAEIEEENLPLAQTIASTLKRKSNKLTLKKPTATEEQNQNREKRTKRRDEKMTARTSKPEISESIPKKVTDNIKSNTTKLV